MLEEEEEEEEVRVAIIFDAARMVREALGLRMILAADDVEQYMFTISDVTMTINQRRVNNTTSSKTVLPSTCLPSSFPVLLINHSRSKPELTPEHQQAHSQARFSIYCQTNS
jgi:hypothetical protein